MDSARTGTEGDHHGHTPGHLRPCPTTGPPPVILATVDLGNVWADALRTPQIEG